MYELVVRDDRGNESRVEFHDITSAVRWFRYVIQIDCVAEAAIYGCNSEGVETRVAYYSY